MKSWEQCENRLLIYGFLQSHKLHTMQILNLWLSGNKILTFSFYLLLYVISGPYIIMGCWYYSHLRNLGWHPIAHIHTKLCENQSNGSVERGVLISLFFL